MSVTKRCKPLLGVVMVNMLGNKGELKYIGAVLAIVSLLLIALLALSQAGVVQAASTSTPMQGPERLSPADRVGWEQITVGMNSISISGLSGARLVSIADTNSMDPTIDAESTAIEIAPKMSSELHLGDIISYKSGSNVIIHRIVEIHEDSDGWYAIVKGDNNSVADPEKVRFEQVKGVVVGIVY